MDSNSVVYAGGIFTGCLIAMGLFMILRAFAKSSHEQRLAKHQEREARKIEDKQRRALDHQLNLGRQARRMLEDFFLAYGRGGFKLSVFEDNGGDFTIQVFQVGPDVVGPGNILQISFKCVSPNGTNNACVHYGAYGTTAWFDASNDTMSTSFRDLVYPRLQVVIYSREVGNTLSMLSQ